MPDPDESLANRRAFLDALKKLDSRPKSGKIAAPSPSPAKPPSTPLAKPLARPAESRVRPEAPVRPEPEAATQPKSEPKPQPEPQAESQSQPAAPPEPPSQATIIAEIGESVRAEAGRIFQVAIPEALPPATSTPAASPQAAPKKPALAVPREMPRLDPEKPEARKATAARREPPRVVAGRAVTQLAEVYVKAPKGPDSRSFQDMVREALSQELRGWLDQNLERVVEDILREEIGRMGREAKDKVAGFTSGEERTGS